MSEKQEGITAKKNDDFSEWYTQVVVKGELADYGPVQGTIAYRPTAYAIWESIQKQFNDMIIGSGHRNVYFPLLIPESLLTREKEHIEGFAPEVFWVTHGGDNKLSERLAVRPTSETVIYSFYSKWVRSWRDLPLLLNQWCNVLRAEIKSTKPFIRGSEFLWQEGHTVHATVNEADEEVMRILEYYKILVEDYLAVPVLIGKKSEREKFAGAFYTTTLEAMMPDGKALQAGTSHNLGQNFSKPFGIQFLDQNNKSQYAWTTSWGVSTRLIGALVMIHGDDRGLVIPPKVAPIKAVIVPIYKGNEGEPVVKKANEIKSALGKHGIAALIDARDDRTPGWKFSEHEMKGIPVRIEIGPKDMKEKKVVIFRRDTAEKKSIEESSVAKATAELLDDIQKNLLVRAREALKKQTIEAKDYADFKKTLEERGGFLKCGWCGSDKCEGSIKEETGATIRVIPFEQDKKIPDCIYCGKQGKEIVYFARAY